ncbi:MAG: amidase domain-containing protein [Chloroflexi bacterium]|nr:amidase domain-containing protein [Chloroflexota bacterium]
MKYVFTGLGIALVVMSLLFSGAVLADPTLVFPTAAPILTSASIIKPSPTATFTPKPTSTFTLTPTMGPAQTATPTSLLPTATLDPIQQMLNSGGLAFNGPLTNQQQISLYRASIYYIATTQADSIRVSKEINGLRYGNPSNTCGPLAIAILRNAGLLNEDIMPHDFWLLNPFIPDDRAKLIRLFSDTQYNHITITNPLNKINWSLMPLEPGDFLYIHAGGGGNFDHMLVVSRVDGNLRAYAVTNFDTSNGFIIDNRMLYDPADRTVGLFHDWTKEPLGLLGSTGFGGIEIWRLRSP